MKYRYLGIEMILLAVLTCAVAAADESPWPMFRHDLRHTGRSPYTGPSTPTLHWTFPANDGIASSPAIGPDGTIYAGAGWHYAGAYDSCLYAINPDGTLKWCFKTDGGLFSSPAIGPDGAIYVGSRDFHLYAIEDSVTYAKLRWRTNLGFWLYSSPALGTDGTIYVGSLDYHLYAVNPDGIVKWQFPTGWCVFSSPAIDSDGTIYIGSKDEQLYALEDSISYAKIRWAYATGQFYDGHLVDSSPAIGPDGTIYVGTDPYGAGGHPPVPVDTGLFAVSPDGTLKWAFPMENGTESSPAIDWDGTIYAGSYDGHLYALADSGSECVLKWEFSTGGPIDGSPAVDGCGTIYVGSNDSTLYAIKPDGTLRWSFRAGGGIGSSPTIGGNGILYFGSFDGNLYALGTGAPDVGIAELGIPDQIDVDSTYSPTATVRNYRAFPQTFEVACLIDTQGHCVYGDTVTVSSLAGGGESIEAFSPWTLGPDTGLVYSITAVCLLPDDDNPLNDSLVKQAVAGEGFSFIRGDANRDWEIGLGDAVYLLNYLFRGEPAPQPFASGDCNCNGTVDLGDVVYLLNYLFKGGPEPSC
jgi:outer membrane protein assembly factor BamB